MVDVIERLKQRARRVHRLARIGDRDALQFLRSAPELRHWEEQQLIAEVRRRHSLTALAWTLGFRGWPHAKAVLAGEYVEDLGTLMFRESGGAFWNVWSAHYDEAAEIREAHGGYLLPYRRHFQIADAHYVRWIGVDPNAEDWTRCGRDWVRPKDRGAWARLTQAAIEARLDRASASSRSVES